jgi:transcriptional regulator with XRE-family HTH domain
MIWMEAKEFKRIRRAAGMSVRELADWLRIMHVQTIKRIECGSRDVTGPISLCMEQLRDNLNDD